MKRSGPLKRYKNLISRTGLTRDTPIRPVSKKRARDNRIRRRVVEQVLASRQRCEAGSSIRIIDQHHVCHGTADDIHEPLTRARGGSITDPDNMVVVCRRCHDWIHTHPDGATTLGLLVGWYSTGYADPSVGHRGQHPSVDDEQRTHMASPQESKDGQGDTGTVVSPSEAVGHTDTESDHGGGHPDVPRQTVET